METQTEQERRRTLQEIETKQLGILSIAKCKGKLTEEQNKMFNFLNNKWRDEKGHLLKGSFYVSSESKWKEVLKE